MLATPAAQCWPHLRMCFCPVMPSLIPLRHKWLADTLLTPCLPALAGVLLQAGIARGSVSFQRCVVPLLRLVTAPQLLNSPLTGFVNPVLARVAAKLDLHRVRCACFAPLSCWMGHKQGNTACQCDTNVVPLPPLNCAMRLPTLCLAFEALRCAHALSAAHAACPDACMQVADCLQQLRQRVSVADIRFMPQGKEQVRSGWTRVAALALLQI